MGKRIMFFPLQLQDFLEVAMLSPRIDSPALAIIGGGNMARSLIGGASLEARSFLELVKAAAEAK